MHRALIALILFAPMITLAAPRTFQDLAALAIKLLNSGIGILLILGLVIFFLGTANMVRKSGESSFSQLGTFLLWGVIAIFMMVSVWGVLALLRNTLFGGGVHTVGGGSRQVLCTGLSDCRIGGE